MDDPILSVGMVKEDLSISVHEPDELAGIMKWEGFLGIR